jgi:FtsP/CotA-like multicopper oxidase with cupredoxin domain
LIFIGVIKHRRTMRRLTTQSTIVIIPVVAMMMSTSSGIFAMTDAYTLSASGNDSAYTKTDNQKTQYAINTNINNNNLVTVNNYDKQKNCTSDLSKRPNSIEYLTHFNCGRVSEENGQTVREFTLIAQENQNISISNEGHIMNGWTFNGTIPGPTMRFTEGDLVRITVINSEENKRAHSLHMHSIHPGVQDGVEGMSGAIAPGQQYTHEFIAQPFGVYPYHCHVSPIADHINRGLYGVMIIDPKEHRENMPEFVMTLNGYDLDYQHEGATIIRPVNDTEETFEETERGNEIYTVNGKAFDYTHTPIDIQAGQKYRIYLVNMLEFDLVNSFHLHGNMFDYITAGTSLKPEYKTDILTLGQGDRGIIEFSIPYAGRYMFHAHVTEFTDLGWMGFFDVKDRKTNNA